MTGFCIKNLMTPFTLFAFIFIGSFFSAIGQPTEVRQRKDKITIYYRNTTEASIDVPVLKFRTDLEGKYMYKEYYQINNDTLHLLISQEVSSNLIPIINREGGGTSSARLLYNDFELQPGNKYKSSIRIRTLPPVSIVFMNNTFIPMRGKRRKQ